MKKIGIALIILMAAMIVTAASPTFVHPAAARVEDVYGSHNLTIFPRPSNSSIATFKPGSDFLEVTYQYNRQSSAGKDVMQYYLAGLPNYQWVDVKSNASEDTQEITATANGWLKDIGLVNIDILIADAGVTVRVYKTGAYVNNECLFYWSKFYSD
jgi:hypothetical protein